MARPQTKGLRYFPFDTDFFEDKKIRLLKGRHCSGGIEVYLRLLCKIYQDNGYFLNWGKSDLELLALDCLIATDKLQLIISSLFEYSLFDYSLF